MADKKSIYIDGVGWRYETEHSMLRRMADHDYQSRCIYMLTLTLEDRSVERLGRLEWMEDKARMVPSALGYAVKDEWLRLEREHPQIGIIRLQLMPEHLHVVVFVRDRLEKPLGKYVGMVKNRCNKHFWRELTEQGLLGAKGEEAPPKLFSEGFTDSVLSHGGQLEAMINYVEQNPYRALVKRDNPEIFRKVDRLEIMIDRDTQGSQDERCSRAASNRTAGNGTAGLCSKELGSFAQAQADGNAQSLCFAAIGNRWLLDRPVRMQVRCHNNTSETNLRLIQRQKAYFLDRGTKGGVVVSPCISAGEKEIARAALDAGIPLIVILENGFPPLYKPPGKYFEACARGLLLMLAPWPYHMEKRTITRQQCLALNDMAFGISNEPWTRELEDRLCRG